MGVNNRNGIWFVDRNDDGLFDPATEIIGWGSPGDTPIAADWNGDGKCDPGIYKGHFIVDRNGNGVFDDPVTGFGLATDQPIVGRW